MAVGVIRERGANAKVTLTHMGNISREFLHDEVLIFTTDTALDENKAQYRQTPPSLASRYVLDKSIVRDLTPSQAKSLVSVSGDAKFAGLKRKVQFFYSNTEVLAKAADYAIRQLSTMTPSAKGQSVNSYYVYCHDPLDPSRSTEMYSGGQPLGSMASRVVNWISQSSNDSINIRIKGPKTEYRRFVIYGRGKSQKTRWVSPTNAYNEGPARDRYKFVDRKESQVSRNKKEQIWTEGRGLVLRASTRARKFRSQALVAKAIQERVRDNVRRQFRDISATYSFKPNHRGQLPLYNSPTWRPSGSNLHIPQLRLAIKRSGARR